MPLEKKHRLGEATTFQGGLFIEASIWSLEEEDRKAISGAGLLEVNLTSGVTYTFQVEVEARGEHIRWETQPGTNIRLHSRLRYDSRMISQIFEVENVEVSRQNFIDVLVRAEDVWNRNIQKESAVRLSFVNSATSKLLYRKENFEQICSIIGPDFDTLNRELLEYFAKHPKYLHKLHWRKFEELLDAIFRNLGYRTELGLGRNDEGVDLRIYQKDEIGEVLTLVQAKKYDPERPIDLQAVAALSAIVDQENAQRGLFVTTSRFLPVAKRFAEKEARRIVLADPSDIAGWCSKVIRKFPDE